MSGAAVATQSERRPRWRHDRVRADGTWISRAPAQVRAASLGCTAGGVGGLAPEDDLAHKGYATPASAAGALTFGRRSSPPAGFGSGCTLIRFALHVVAPIVAGALVYALCRTTQLRMFQWLDAVGLGTLVASCRKGAAGVSVPEIVRFSLPDGLWAYSVASGLALFWRNEPSRRFAMDRAIWFSVSIALTVGVEVSQGVGLVAGTFDVADLAASTLGISLGWTLTKRRETEGE